MASKDKIVIGITGSFGSGCTYISKEFFEKEGYKYYSLSEELHKQFDGDDSLRANLQDFGNDIRRKNKKNDILARWVYDKFKGKNDKKIVIDSIRNTAEIEFLQKIPGRFFLFGIFAETETRWERVKDENYRIIETGGYDRQLFDINDNRDKDEEEITYGQQIKRCFKLSDIIINNNKHIQGIDKNYYLMKGNIRRYLDLIEQKEEAEYEPSQIETLMTIAYALSMRSSCLKRQVGAVIVDDYGTIFSSGYNEVPKGMKPCKEEHFKGCYRDYIRKKALEEGIKKFKDIDSEELKKYVNSFKALDYCRAIHGEEKAIINLGKFGGITPLVNPTLYTTTYPCNLCANKIVDIGIKKIIYLEAYPMGEAKELLDLRKIEQIPFEGVLYNGYFKFMRRGKRREKNGSN